MPAHPEYDRLDGTGLAVLVRRGEVAPAELVDAAIERIEALNPRLNAVVARCYSFFQGHAPARDSEIVRRLKAAGLIIVGSLN